MMLEQEAVSMMDHAGLEPSKFMLSFKFFSVPSLATQYLV
jgi:hypothetical protein